MRKITGAQAINEAIREEMKQDENCYYIGEDIGLYHEGRGLNGVGDGLLEEFGPQRVVETPISESCIVGSSVGAAMFGMRPIVEIMHSEFLATCFEHLVYGGPKGSTNADGILVPMTVRAPCGGSEQAQAIQNENCEAWFCNTPGLTVVEASNPYDLKGLLKSAIRSNYPVLFFEHNSLYKLSWEVPEVEYTLPLGKAQVKRPGTDVSIITYGNMVNRALQAAVQLEQEGINTEVIDVMTLVPLDRQTILTSVQKTGRAVVLYEARKSGGYGAEIAAVIAEQAFNELKAPIIRCAGPDVAVNYPKTVEQITEAVRRIFADK